MGTHVSTNFSVANLLNRSMTASCMLNLSKLPEFIDRGIMNYARGDAGSGRCKIVNKMEEKGESRYEMTQRAWRLSNMICLTSSRYTA